MRMTTEQRRAAQSACPYVRLLIPLWLEDGVPAKVGRPASWHNRTLHMITRHMGHMCACKPRDALWLQCNQSRCNTYRAAAHERCGGGTKAGGEREHTLCIPSLILVEAKSSNAHEHTTRHTHHTQTPTHPQTPTHQHPPTNTHTPTHPHTHPHTHTQTPRHSDTQTPRHPDTQTPGHPDTQTPKHPGTQTPRHPLRCHLWKLILVFFGVF